MNAFPNRPFHNGPQGVIPSPIPFPRDDATSSVDRTCLPESTSDVLQALDTMSRRIDDLARELDCLGYFDDGDDGPRAA